MASLDLKVEDASGDILTEKTFHLLRGFLQPDTSLTLDSTAQSILDLLSPYAPHSTEVWVFGETCIELAEQIPYYHPSQLKFAELLEYLGQSAVFGQIDTATSPNKRKYHRYQRLGESLRDALNTTEPENANAYANFHAFAANIHERRIFRTNPTWAIWAQREAHETAGKEQGRYRDGYVLAAAQWILWYGQSLFKQVLFPGEISSRDLQRWKPGPLYCGKAYLSLQRWHFWRDGFKSVASGEKEKVEWVSQECTNVAAKAAEMMDSMERNMTFDASDRLTIFGKGHARHEVGDASRSGFPNFGFLRHFRRHS
ncbi:MAG: hypothetical protein M1837_001978 [Sclerophora amabilis]|nr:MAG: hypothetical protein M1837_001978 [Sclerophora amabilis]